MSSKVAEQFQIPTKMTESSDSSAYLPAIVTVSL